ncbi:MAG: Gmad2 immunoglobulin-like domain-containing protein [Patescibacteria group bacterium]|nr:Gmad2 immunoglobulin-like domain-containing protein [Patescibacteria group bacterium]
MKNNFFVVIVSVLAVFAVFGAGCSTGRTTYDVPRTTSTIDKQILQEVTSTPAVKVVKDEWTSKDGITKLRFTDVSEDGKPIVYNPFFVYGTTTVFENQFSWRLKDSKGVLVSSGRAYANSPDSGLPGPFTIKVFFDQSPTATDGFFEVYDNSPKDGAEISLLKVSVNFGNLLTAVLNEADPATSDLYVYFPNKQKDPNFLDCSNAYLVKYTVLDDGTVSRNQNEFVAAVLHALLKGPTPWAVNHGFFTSLPTGVNEPEVVTSEAGDEIVLNFDETLEQGVGGSCRVLSIRSQIIKSVQESLLKNNFWITTPKVTISINGRTEDILQP